MKRQRQLDGQVKSQLMVVWLTSDEKTAAVGRSDEKTAAANVPYAAQNGFPVPQTKKTK